MRLLLLVIAAIAVLAAWTALVIAGTAHEWWRAPLAARGDARAFADAVAARIDRDLTGNAAFVLLCGGEPCGSHYASRGEPVGPEALFQVASLSKWITAWGVMALAEAGRIDLDAPVSRYVTRWTLPPSDFDNDEVTVRRLMSHTAGLTDGLGYLGFAGKPEVQTLEASLTQAADAWGDASGRTLVGKRPGAGWQYSGGGYALLQLMIEEVSGEPFDTYMRRTVLHPLGMRQSGFELGAADEAKLSQSFNEDGEVVPHAYFSATGAASLYTSADELVRFLQAQATGGSVLAPETVAAMREPEARQFGIPIWGLGQMLFARNGTDGFIVGHDGQNAPAINTTARIDPATGDGIIVLSSGSTHFANDLGAEWVYWRTGQADIATIAKKLPLMLGVWAGGVVLALLGFLGVVFAGRK